MIVVSLSRQPGLLATAAALAAGTERGARRAKPRLRQRRREVDAFDVELRHGGE